MAGKTKNVLSELGCRSSPGGLQLTSQQNKERSSQLCYKSRSTMCVSTETRLPSELCKSAYVVESRSVVSAFLRSIVH